MGRFVKVLDTEVAGRVGNNKTEWVDADDVSSTTGVHDPGDNGYMSRTGYDVAIARTFQAGTGINVSNGNGVEGDTGIALADTPVTPGSYTNTNLTVDQQGRITAAANGSDGGISGSGSINRLAKFTGATEQGDSRITDDGVADINIGTSIVFQSSASLLKFGAGTVNGFGYASGTGPYFRDDGTESNLILNVQSLSANRTLTCPDRNGTIATVAGPMTNTRLVVIDPDGNLVQSDQFFQSGTHLAPVSHGISDLGTMSLAFRQLFLDATITPAATVGAQTINKSAGSVNFGAGASSLVVTCDKCSENSIVIAVVATDDATAIVKSVVPAAGSFTIRLSAAATNETRVNFWVLN